MLSRFTDSRLVQFVNAESRDVTFLKFVPNSGKDTMLVLPLNAVPMVVTLSAISCVTPVPSPHLVEQMLFTASSANGMYTLSSS